MNSWTDASGKKWQLEDMTNGHVTNVIGYLKDKIEEEGNKIRKAQARLDDQANRLAGMLLEQEKRKKTRLVAEGISEYLQPTKRDFQAEAQRLWQEKAKSLARMMEQNFYGITRPPTLTGLSGLAWGISEGTRILENRARVSLLYPAGDNSDVIFSHLRDLGVGG